MRARTLCSDNLGASEPRVAPCGAISPRGTAPRPRTWAAHFVRVRRRSVRCSECSARREKYWRLVSGFLRPYLCKATRTEHCVLPAGFYAATILAAVQVRLVAGPAPGSGKHRAQEHARTSQHIIKTAYFAACAPAAHQIRSAAGKHHRGSLCALPWRERRFELRAPAPSTGGALGPARLHVSRA